MTLNYSSLTSGGTRFSVIAVVNGDKTATLDNEYPAGTYSVTSALADTDLEIYLGTSAGVQVGQFVEGKKYIKASAPFKYVTTSKSNQDDTISFELLVAEDLAAKTDAIWGPVLVTECTPSSVPNIGDKTTIIGANFAPNATVTLRRSDNSTTFSPKVTTYLSATAIEITRPDSLSPDNAPYDVIVTNPDTGLSYRLDNGLTAGSNPVWVTATTIPFIKGQYLSQSFSATDSDGGSTVTYSWPTQGTDTIPNGLTVDLLGAKIEGTPTQNTGSYSVTIRATDSGGNTADRTFTLVQRVPDAPTIGVGSQSATGTASITFTAPAYTGTSAITSYTAIIAQGGYTGTASSSPITITGIPDGTSYTAQVYATNAFGNSLNSDDTAPFAVGFQISTTSATTTTSGGYTYYTWKSSGTMTTTASKTMDILTIGGGAGGTGKAGPGAGGQLFSSSVNVPAGTYTVQVGGTTTDSFIRNSNTSVDVTRAFKGGVGSGNGSSWPTDQYPGTPGQGNPGGIGAWTPGIYSSGGGGGAGGTGGNRQNQSGGPGGAGSATYASWAQLAQTGINGFAGGGAGGGRFGQAASGGFGSGFGGNDSQKAGPATANTGSGAGGDNFGGNTTGGTGLVMIRYTTT